MCVTEKSYRLRPRLPFHGARLQHHVLPARRSGNGNWTLGALWREGDRYGDPRLGRTMHSTSIYPRWPSWFPASDVPGESSKELHPTEGLAVSCALYGGCEGQEEQEREGRSGVCNWFITYRCGGGFILLWETVFCFRFFFCFNNGNRSNITTMVNIIKLEQGSDSKGRRQSGYAALSLPRDIWMRSSSWELNFQQFIGSYSFNQKLVDKFSG